MSIAYLNGAWMALEEARVSVFDRGFMFGDAVYEVMAVYGRKIFMHQREGMNQFHGTGRSIKDFLTRGKSISRGINQCSAVSFACPDADIAHRFMKKGRRGARGRYQVLKAPVNALTPSRPIWIKLVGMGHASPSSKGTVSNIISISIHPLLLIS